MGLGIISTIIVLLAVILLFKIINFGLRVIGFVILALALGITVWICAVQPDMHKPFSLNTIEYLFKINKDGSMTTTKQVTQTIYKEKNSTRENGDK